MLQCTYTSGTYQATSFMLWANMMPSPCSPCAPSIQHPMTGTRHGMRKLSLQTTCTMQNHMASIARISDSSDEMVPFHLRSLPNMHLRRGTTYKMNCRELHECRYVEEVTLQKSFFLSANFEASLKQCSIVRLALHTQSLSQKTPFQHAFHDS